MIITLMRNEFLFIGKPNTLKQLDKITILIGDALVEPTGKAKNIGAEVDSHLDMSDLIYSVIHTCYAHLEQIAHICPYLTEKASATLVNSVITSRLDYINSFSLDFHNI